MFVTNVWLLGRTHPSWSFYIHSVSPRAYDSEVGARVRHPARQSACQRLKLVKAITSEALRLCPFMPGFYPFLLHIQAGLVWRFAAQNREQRGEGKSEIFTFLGFTH
jgi:hypothetical protein